jgi:hypothetical protein
VAGRGGDADEATHAVADDDGRAVDPTGFGDGDDLVGPGVQGVDVPVAAVAMTRKVDGDHPEVGREPSRHMRPPVGVGTATVDEHEPPRAGPAPGQEVDGDAVDLDRAVLEGHGQRLPEPVRRARVRDDLHDRHGGTDRGRSSRPAHSVAPEVVVAHPRLASFP